MADSRPKRTRMISAGLLILLIVTNHRSGPGSDINLLVDGLSMLARLPALLRVFVVAAVTGR
jgi:hypothetical protein